MAHNAGRPLEAGELYKVDVSADVPVKQFWSLIYVPDSTQIVLSTARLPSDRSSLAQWP
jgi:hypothetical protein